MQHLSKPELISALDFIFDTQKATDTQALYQSLEKLARDTLHCDELVIGTCSDTPMLERCRQKLPVGQACQAAPASARSPCGASPPDPAARAAGATDLSHTGDGIMVCNYSNEAAGVCAAFVVKDKPLTENQQLLDGLKPYLVAAIDRIAANGATAARPSKPREPVVLTLREKEILHWVSLGKSCGETGSILGVTERTVKFHLQNVYRKLEVVNRAQAVTVAHQYALL